MEGLGKSKHSIEEIVNYFVQSNKSATRIIPKERRKYVIYLRKSTDDPKRQVRSIDDQKKECKAAARANDIRPEQIVKIIQEKASAKKSDNRPKFTEMINEFKSGKIQGLISWAPDRLSRNMKEGGEIIELVDKEIIQDLIFATYQFDNTPSGKMTLGILFATSKQYSDKLSVDARRGIKGNVLDGKYNGFIKAGYYVDQYTHHFMPDSEMWSYMRKAFEMKLNEKATDAKIAAYLNSVGLAKRTFKTDKFEKCKVTSNMVNRMMSDEFYAGVYKTGETVANLTDLYAFKPVITPDEFLKINKSIGEVFGEGNSNGSKKQYLEYSLLSGKVICGYCDQPMTMEKHKLKKGKNKGRYSAVFYHHPNKMCRRWQDKKDDNGNAMQKSVNVRYVISGIAYALQCCTKKTQEAYDYYIDELKAKQREDLKIAERKQKEATNALREARENLKYLKDLRLKNEKEYNAHYAGDLETTTTDIAEYNRIIDEAKAEKERLKQELPTKEEFFELVDLYLEKLQNTTSLLEQDEICQKVVSNLKVKNNVVSEITLNPPFNIMADFDKNSLGWG